MDPELVREILSKSYVFHRRMHPFRQLLSRGLAAYEMDKWAKHRRLINPAFHLEKLKLMVPAFHLSSSDMLSQLEKIVPTEGSREVDVWPFIQTFTSDAISRTAFGSNYEEGRKIFELQKEQAHLILQAKAAVYIPGRRFLPTKINRRIKHVSKEVGSSILGLIDKRMKAIKAGEACGDDLLGILLESNFKEIQQNGNKFGMSLQEVVEECKLFYFGGQETSASLLAWTMMLLAKHSEWQARAREEVLQAFGKGKPNYQELNHLKIVTMIINEVLRLYPPGALLDRTTTKEVSVGNAIIPAGVKLLMPIAVLHLDTKTWGPDAKEFDPNRFSEGVAKATEGHLSYFPFGWGPRSCIAQNFALLEAKMAIATILQHYAFELSPSYSHAPFIVVTLHPQYGAHLIMRRV